MKGLTYYQADTNRFKDIKVRKLMKKFGASAYTVYAFALNEVFLNGYYMQFTDDTLFEMSEALYMEESDIEAIISFAIEVGLFDKQMWENEHVLTSKSIQRRYNEINARFRRKSVVDLYNLLSDEECAEEELSNGEMLHNEIEQTQNVAFQDENVAFQDENVAFDSRKNKKDNIYPSFLPAHAHTRESDKPMELSEKIDSYAADLLGDDAWLDAVANEFRMARDALAAKLAAFVAEKKTDLVPYQYDHKHDFVKHFKRWLRISNDIETRTKRNTNGNNTNGNGKAKTDSRLGITQTTATGAKDYSTTF